MKKDFIVSKIDSPQDGIPYVFVAFTDPNESKSAGKSRSSYLEAHLTLCCFTTVSAMYKKMILIYSINRKL